MNPVNVQRGNSPVILGFPHGGTHVPPAIRERLNDNGRMLGDTDWHIAQLYDGLLPGATTINASFHRYVIDANRDPSGASLYPGQNTTGLIPATDFDGIAIWREGQEPTPADIAARLADFHQPYHAALLAEIVRVRKIHGIAVLYDCHSIRSRIPFLFPGLLPDFNVGTAGGLTCDPEIESGAMDIIQRAAGYTRTLNGRFKGGWTTRHYGQPGQGVHAIQIELSQRTHLFTEAPPYAYDPGKAAPLRSHLAAVLHGIESVALKLASDKGDP